MAHELYVKRLTVADELTVRRYLMRTGDTELAMHRQLNDYFLTTSGMFGAHGVFDSDKIANLVLWSRYGPTTFVHLTITLLGVHEVIREAGGFPASAFFREPLVPDSSWRLDLAVTPGYVTDHPAYEGVFSRVAPRFAGGVYAHD